MRCRFPETLRRQKLRSLVLFFILSTGLASVLAGCVPRPALHFSPADDPPLRARIRESSSRPVAVLPFADERTVSSAAGDPQLIGWGTGTGTLNTRDDIKAFVAESFVREMEHLGLSARLVSVSMPPFGDPENRLSRARKSVRGHEVVLLGSMAEFQFQVNHPRYGVGAEFSLLDMQNATLDCQVQLNLRFVDAGTGEVLWKGTLFSEEEKNVHVAVPGMELEQAAELLSANLRKVILEAIAKWSALGY